MKALIKIKEELCKEYRILCRQYDDKEAKIKKEYKKKFGLKKDLFRIESNLELSKIGSRIEIIANTIDAVDAKIKLYSEIQSNPNNNTASSSSIIEAINNMKQVIEKDYQKLDTLLEKEQLKREFNIERKKGLAKYELEEYITSGAILGLTLIAIPANLFLSSLLPLSIPAITTISCLIGAITTTILKVNYTNKRIKLFKRLNNKLKDEKLSETSQNTLQELDEIFEQISKKKTDLTIMTTILKEQEKSYEESKEQERKQTNTSLTHQEEYTEDYSKDDQIKLSLRK